MDEPVSSISGDEVSRGVLTTEVGEIPSLDASEDDAPRIFVPGVLQDPEEFGLDRILQSGSAPSTYSEATGEAVKWLDNRGLEEVFIFQLVPVATAKRVSEVVVEEIG